MKIVDLRSDTVTKPSLSMREKMAKAKVGDDVYREDPTINELESKAAEIVGKEAALFVPSGTMGNQVAVMTHTQPGEEIILGKKSHIFYYEVGGVARLSGLQARTLDDDTGILKEEEVKYAIREEDLHYPETGLICLENTHNKAGGVAVSKEKVDKVCKIAHQKGIPVHLDGARLFNASLELGIESRKLVENVDSVMFCLSKGLGAPVGSILAGSKDFIRRARKNRKRLGGGMRQAGILAAAGILALENRKESIKKSHRLAEKLAEGIKKLKLNPVNLHTTNTNFVILKVNPDKYKTEKFITKLAEEGVKVSQFDQNLIRIVTHRDLSDKDIEYALEVLAKME